MRHFFVGISEGTIAHVYPERKWSSDYDLVEFKELEILLDSIKRQRNVNNQAWEKNKRLWSALDTLIKNVPVTFQDPDYLIEAKKILQENLVNTDDGRPTETAKENKE